MTIRKAKVKLFIPSNIFRGTITSSTHLNDIKRAKREKKIRGKVLFLMMNSTNPTDTNLINNFIINLRTVVPTQVDLTERRVNNIYIIDSWETPDLFAKDTFGRGSIIIDKVPALVEYRANGSVILTDYFPSILKKLQINKTDSTGKEEEEEEFPDI